MRLTLLILIGISVVASTFGQQGFNYQASIRNNSGGIIQNANLQIRLSILDGSVEGVAVYVELHQTNTNDEGIFNVVVGNGAVQSGNFMNISWGGVKYLKVQIDPLGGTNFLDFGITQLQAVPMAIHAHSANETQNLQAVLSQGAGAGNNVISDLAEPVNAQDAATKNYVDSKVSTVVDGDSDNLNEIQDLTLSGGKLKITNNSSATEIDIAPFLGTNTDHQDLELDLSTHTLRLTNDATTVDLTPYVGWSKKGNAVSDATTEFIGTTNATPLSIRTNGAERIHISANGNIGMGVTPAHKLHVVSAGDLLSDAIFGDDYVNTLLESPGGEGGFNFSLVSRIKGTQGNNYGIYGSAEGSTTGLNRGMYGFATGSSAGNRGIMGVANHSVGVNAGVYGVASGSDANNVGGFFMAAQPTTKSNVAISAAAHGGGLESRGINASGEGSPVLNIGGHFSAVHQTSTQENIGVRSIVGPIGDVKFDRNVAGEFHAWHSNPAGTNYGLYSLVGNANRVYGGYFSATATTPSTLGIGKRYGIFATADGGAENYAGYFQGDVEVTEKITINKLLRLKPGAQPASPVEGDIYYDATEHTLKFWNGSVWKTLSAI